MSLPDVAAYSRRTGDAARLLRHGAEPRRLRDPAEAPQRSRRDVDEVIDDLRTKIAATAAGDPHGLRPAPRGQHRRSHGRRAAADRRQDLRRGPGAPPGEGAGRGADRARQSTGVEDVFDGITVAGRSSSSTRRPDALARFGMTAEALHAEVEPAVGGTVAGRTAHRRAALRHPRLLAARRPDVARLSRPADPDAVRIARVPLSVLADVSTGTPEVEIQRENLRTYLGVTGAALATVASAARSRRSRRSSRRGLALPPGMSLALRRACTSSSRAPSRGFSASSSAGCSSSPSSCSSSSATGGRRS